jgi:benzoyl-CoA reductase/2-hydroxyglutaryl-CoA dehydratase subunit BcrC/BadD/HgdB
MILITARHAAPTTCTPRDKQMSFSERNRDKEKQNETIPNLNSNLAKSMTHHNQTKELTTWFLNF